MSRYKVSQTAICSIIFGALIFTFIIYFYVKTPLSSTEIRRRFRSPSQKALEAAVYAAELARKVRVLCFVKTSPLTHESRAVHVKATWGKRCDKLLFVTEKNDTALYPILLVNVSTSRQTLSAKVVSAIDQLYRHHLNDADWFMEADDDTYVIVENLRYFLSTQDPELPVYYGHVFTYYMAQGYSSGGSGYVFSKEALRRYGQRPPNLCPDQFNPDSIDDVYMGKCFQYLGVKLGDSRDAQGRSRFHCFNPTWHLVGGYPDWYYYFDKYGAKNGQGSISNYAVSFHYVYDMYEMEFYFYHLRPLNAIEEYQPLNQPIDPNITTGRIELNDMKPVGLTTSKSYCPVLNCYAFLVSAWAYSLAVLLGY